MRWLFQAKLELTDTYISVDSFIGKGTTQPGLM